MRSVHLFMLVLVVAATAVSCGGKSAASGASGPQGNAGTASAKITFIELGSVNCIPCRMMQPIMDEIRTTYPRDVEVVFHDVWTPEGQPYGSQFGIRVIPTQVFLDADGKEFFRHEGFLPLEQLVQVLKSRGAEQ